MQYSQDLQQDMKHVYIGYVLIASILLYVNISTAWLDLLEPENPLYVFR